MRRWALLIACLAACQTDGIEGYEETQVERFCGTIEPSEGAKLVTESEVARMPQRDAVDGATIAVYVHVIAKGRGADNGEVTDAAIEQQLGVLQRAFAGTPWRFELAGIDRVTNPDWFPLPANTQAERDAKAILRKGDARTLNIYTTDPGQGMLGYATYPTDYKARPFQDGVVVLHSTLPGGTDPHHNLGDNLVHQVGHWLGLYHTFAADCSTDRGDFVSDTPPSSVPAFGCPVGRDTCGAAGDDAVLNYMDVSDDACRNAFTPGQVRRIKVQFDAFRRY